MNKTFTLYVDEVNNDKTVPVHCWAKAEFISIDDKQIAMGRSRDFPRGYVIKVGYKSSKVHKSKKPEDKGFKIIDLEIIPDNEREFIKKLIQEQISGNTKPHSYIFFPPDLREYKIEWEPED